VTPWQSGQAFRVEVEPPSDARWARIERDLFAKLDAAPAPVQLPVDALVDDLLARPAPRPQAWAAAAATLGAIAATVAMMAFLRSSSFAGHAADPVTLTTTDTAMAFVVGESELTMAPLSSVAVTGDDQRGMDVALEHGTVTCEVAPRHGRPPFRVDAGDVHVRVIGTRFTVTRDPASVSVAHGVVEVTAAGQVTILHDGERWPALPAGDGANVPPGTASGAAAAASDAAKAKAARRAHAGTRHLGAASPAADDGFDDDDPSSLDDPAAQASAPVAAPAIPTASPAQQAFEAATHDERTHPGRAAAAYQELAAGATPWAPNALFALARLEADRGHRSEAADLLRSYLARYPSGLNAADARVLLQRLQ
jgi:ferric-dicitrate binding protein FerR (iron transport regulator)